MTHWLRVVVIVAAVIGLAQLFDPWALLVGMVVMAIVNASDRRRDVSGARREQAS